jgi:hypothetical protein
MSIDPITRRLIVQQQDVQAALAHTATTTVPRVVNPYKFSAQSTGQAIPANTTTQLVFPAVLYDTGSSFDGTTGLYAVPVTGYYSFKASVGFSSIGAAGYIFLDITTDNGRQIAIGGYSYEATTTSAIDVVATADAYLSAGQCVLCQVNIPAAETTSAGVYTQFCGHLFSGVDPVTGT